MAKLTGLLVFVSIVLGLIDVFITGGPFSEQELGALSELQFLRVREQELLFVTLPLLLPNLDMITALLTLASLDYEVLSGPLSIIRFIIIAPLYSILSIRAWTTLGPLILSAFGVLVRLVRG